MIKASSIKILLLSRSFLILLAMLFVGKWLQQTTGLPIPGSIYGLLILFLLLSIRIMPLNYVLPAGSLLLNYITLLFVPVGVGLLKYTDLLAENWLSIVVSSLVSSVLVLLVVGWCFQRLSK